MHSWTSSPLLFTSLLSAFVLLVSIQSCTALPSLQSNNPFQRTELNLNKNKSINNSTRHSISDCPVSRTHGQGLKRTRRRSRYLDYDLYRLEAREALENLDQQDHTNLLTPTEREFDSLSDQQPRVRKGRSQFQHSVVHHDGGAVSYHRQYSHSGRSVGNHQQQAVPLHQSVQRFQNRTHEKRVKPSGHIRRVFNLYPTNEHPRNQQPQPQDNRRHNPRAYNTYPYYSPHQSIYPQYQPYNHNYYPPQHYPDRNQPYNYVHNAIQGSSDHQIPTSQVHEQDYAQTSEATDRSDSEEHVAPQEKEEEVYVPSKGSQDSGELRVGRSLNIFSRYGFLTLSIKVWERVFVNLCN